MKTLFGLFTVFTLFIGACKKTEVPNNPNPVHPLEGVWHMESYWTYSPDPMPTFGPNDVLWNFQINQNKVTVTYNVNAPYEYILTAGVHSLSVNGNILTIDGIQYEYTFTNGDIKIERYFAPGEPMIADLPECTLSR